MSGLPSGWKLTSVGKLASSLVDGPFGSNLKSEHYSDSGTRVIRLQNIGDGYFDDRDKAFVPTEHAERLQRHEASSGDVLIAAMGDVLPRTCLVPPDIGPAIVKADCFRLRPHLGISSPLLAYFLSSPQVRRQASTQISGVGRPRLNLRKVSELAIPLPPSNEQRRIVAAIEEQFSRLDAGATALRSAKRRLQRLRDVGIFALIEGTGARVRLADVSEIRLGRQRSPKNHAGSNMVPYLRAANVTWQGLDLSDVKSMHFSQSEVSTFRLNPGDVLIAEASGSASEVGKSAIWDGRLTECCFQNTLLRIRSDCLLPEYLNFVMVALARSGAFARASRGVGIHHLGKAGLENVMIEVPDLATQSELVGIMGSQQSTYAELDELIEAQLTRAERLRHSILASGFSGSLVDQDPGDEPASVLLERILEERSSGAKGMRGRTPRTSQKAQL